MTVVTKYGHVEVDGIPADEPIFILRAQDKAALSTLFHYWSKCHDLGSPDGHLDSCQNAIGDFERWQRRHRQRIKVAD